MNSITENKNDLPSEYSLNANIFKLLHEIYPKMHLNVILKFTFRTKRIKSRGRDGSEPGEILQPDAMTSQDPDNPLICALSTLKSWDHTCHHMRWTD